MISTNKKETEKNITVLEIYLKLWENFSNKRKKQFIFIASFSLLSGLAEVITLATLIPFLMLITNSKDISKNLFLSKSAEIFSIQTNESLLFLSTIIFSIIIICSACIRIFNYWISCRISALIGNDLSIESYRQTIYLPYEKIIQKNSSKIITVVVTHIAHVVTAINAFLQLITSSVVAISIIVSILIINWKAAIFTGLIFCISYILLAKYLRTKLLRNSQKEERAATNQLKSLQEGLGSVRDIILNSSQKYYLNKYNKYDLSVRNCASQNTFLGIFPRYSFESLGLITISLITVIIRLNDSSGSNITPLLGTMALGSLKLLPALQNIYGSWVAISSRTSSIIKVLETLTKRKIVEISNINSTNNIDHEDLLFSNVEFHYQSNKTNVLQNININISSGDKIGIIGSTGNGKSTFLDLLMGLLKPTSGEIIIGDKNLHDDNYPERLLRWRSSISHVPQQIFLSDNTFAENISLCPNFDEIDWERLRMVSSISKILDFIESSKNGFYTYVGERGIQLSGGQRQRVAIARALYKKSSLLILDEATSSLDTKTERAIIDSINNYNQNITILSIAHRISTLDNCERIFKVSQKSVFEIKKDELIT